MSARARLAEISNTLQAIQGAWPYVLAEIDSRIESLTVQLISQESEQVRGRIKSLSDLNDMPETLQHERDALSAALAAEAAAN
jgi:hypothetical protein